jgi:peptidoglycan hydrolase-like protein with peptidoglycan-binding domain
MKRFLIALSISLLMAAPLVALAAGGDSTRASLPAAVDQLLAQDMIQLAQTQLKVAGFDPGRFDGIFDQKTSQAVSNYQRAMGLPVSGLLDEATRADLWPGFDAADQGKE